MKNYRLLLLLIISIVTLPGCNSIYLYETEKYSLTIEGRPDASSPVSFNLGVKQRVATVIPEKQSDTDVNNCTVKDAQTKQGIPNIIQKHGEAMSLISYFNLNKTASSGPFNDPITVETAILTGKVASCIEDVKLPEILTSMVPGTFQDQGANYSIMRNIVGILRDDHQQKQLEALNELAITAFPKTYPVSIFVLKDENNLFKKKKKDSLTEVIDMDSALDYWGNIDASANTLNFILAAPNGYKFNDIPVDNEVIQTYLKSENEQSKLELERIGNELAGNPVYINAVQFYIDNYLKQTKSGN
jgi:hypothetical protein